jgi:hypothetical protein
VSIPRRIQSSLPPPRPSTTRPVTHASFIPLEGVRLPITNHSRPSNTLVLSIVIYPSPTYDRSRLNLLPISPCRMCPRRAISTNTGYRNTVTASSTAYPHRSSSCLPRTSSPAGYSTCCRRPCHPCLFILTEGDSKALTVAGGVVGHDNFGVFLLRGKLLNVREAKHDQIMKNEEIQDIKKIMGLQHNKDVPPPYRAASLKSTSAPRPQRSLSPSR